MLILLFCIFSNFQTIYFSNKAFPALQIRFRRKLLKKGKKRYHTYNSNKLENCPLSKASDLHFVFYIYFRNHTKKKKHLKRPFSSHEESTRQHGVLKLTNSKGNKSLPKFCKLNLIRLCHVYILLKSKTVQHSKLGFYLFCY